MHDGLISIERSDDISTTANNGNDSLSGLLGRGRHSGQRLPSTERAIVREPSTGFAGGGDRMHPAVRDGELGRVVRPLRQRHRVRGSGAADADAIVDAHPDPVMVVNGQHEILRSNQAARRLFGDDLDQRALDAVPVAAALVDATDRVMRSGRMEMVDFALHGPLERHFRCRIGLLPDDAPAQAEHERTALLTITDFTEVKRAERARADFVANASHELRTPLAILMGFIETLTGPAADDPDAQQRFLPIMHQQAGRMARLVDDLLSLSRIELTEHAPPTAKVRLPALLRGVAQALRLRAAERGMWIELRIARNLAAVIGDADELSQVFQNLIDNAIKYAAPNTPIVVSAARSATIPHEVAISVRDQGEGIAEHHLPRLTERFYRVDTARSCAAGGTGLGLAIVKHVLTRHRGRLEVESRLGEGTTFTVCLSAGIATNRKAADHAEAVEEEVERPARTPARVGSGRRPISRERKAARRTADVTIANRQVG